jgi:hypothetical protein
MNNLRFFIILSITVLGLGAAFVLTLGNKTDKPRPGTEQSDAGREHIAVGAKVSYKEPIPTSGTHSVQPASWGISETELPDESIVHSMEHGGVVVSYKSGIDPATKNQLTALFEQPYSNKDFRPTKAIVMPRDSQSAPIVLSSWKRLQELKSYDENAVIEYYTRNIGNSPEPNAR